MFSSCLVTLCDLMDCSLPGSSVHGISQSRILEWVALSASRESSSPKGQTHISCIGRQILYHWAVGKAQVFSYTVCLFEGDKSAWVMEKAGVLWCCCFLGFEAVDPFPRFLSGSVFKTGTWSFLSGKVKHSPVGHPKPSSFLRFLEIFSLWGCLSGSLSQRCTKRRKKKRKGGWGAFEKRHPLCG